MGFLAYNKGMQYIHTHQLRTRLKHYYSALELLDGVVELSGKSLVIIERNKPFSSAVEGSVVRRLDLLEKTEEMARALSLLPREYQKLLELKYGKGLSLRMAARQLYFSETSTRRLEGRALAALASALGAILLDY